MVNSELNALSTGLIILSKMAPRQFFNKIDHSDDVIKKERLTVLALKEEVTQQSPFKIQISGWASKLKHVQLLSSAVSEGFISPKEIIKIQLYNMQSNAQAVHSICKKCNRAVSQWILCIGFQVISEGSIKLITKPAF